MSIETDSHRVISILKNIKQEKLDFELDSLSVFNNNNNNNNNNSDNTMNSDRRSTRKPRSNTVEVKLSKQAPSASSRSKSPRPKSRSQSRSRKSLPTAAKPPSPQRKSASPARSIRATKKAPAANLGAKLYTKVNYEICTHLIIFF
jgi:hypothetical protein